MDAKTLCRYIFPAVGGLFATYLYNVVDGIFVGQGVGTAALGAVNIGVPFITFVVAVAAMFPMGGATVAAIRMGRGVAVKALAIFALPTLFGTSAVWAAPLAAEVVTFILAVGLERHSKLAYA